MTTKDLSTAILNFLDSNLTDEEIDYWAKLSHWEFEEAAALSLGKNPKLLTLDITRLELTDCHDSALTRWLEMRELLLRSDNFDTFYEKVIPAEFIRWAKGRQIDIPSSIAKRVSRSA